MNHDTLKRAIFDQHEAIRRMSIVNRDYRFDPNANHALVGLRRAGKSTLLYKRVRDLVDAGVGWERIIYVNFEDERLAEFTTADFDDLLLVQSELSEQPGYFFFDELQNIPNWEKFARRMADAKERIDITGSNAKMLSGEIATTLGGRFLSMQVSPYSFVEFVRANGIADASDALAATKSRGRVQALFDDYFRFGGFPESLERLNRRQYVESVYQKVLLGDIAARNGVRNPQVLRLLMKKVAETVRGEISFTKLRNALRGVGASTSTDSVIDYIGYAKDSFLIFDIRNAVLRFTEREGNPKYYFSDNGLLNLFLVDKDTALLENVVACALQRVSGEGLYYLKSSEWGVDIDFYLPDQGVAVQVAYSIEGEARDREIGNLAKLAQRQGDVKRLVIVTKEGAPEIVEERGCRIEVVPAYRFLLEDPLVIGEARERTKGRREHGE